MDLDTEPTQPITPASEIEGIRQCCLDYAEGWYTADPERMRGCLHPDLVKRTLVRDPQTGSVLLRRALDAEMMVTYTRAGGGSPVPESRRIYQVVIQDIFRQVACAKVISAEYIDYLHLARFDQRWLIINVLWELKEGELGPVA